MIPLRPHSQVADVCLPTVPRPPAAVALAVQFQLERSQWWTPREMVAEQCRQMALLFRHAFAHVPLYRERLAAAGWTERTKVFPRLIRRIPVLDRSDVQSAGEALRAARIPREHGRVYLVKTSGSTGRPVRVQGTELTQFFWRNFALRDHLWHRRDLTGKLAAIRWRPKGEALPPNGVTQDSWSSATFAAFPTGPFAMLNSAADIGEQFAWLVKQDPDYLLSHPSNLVALAERFQEKGRRLPRLREVRTVGEVVSERVRAACRAAWGVQVSDVYTCQEAGYLALQCPEQGHYHVQAENVYLEVVDEHGRPCRPGQVGRVLITSLNNFATPLIRYAIGDYAEVGEPCSCGRGLPVLTRIVGRVRNMLCLPGGERRWPNFGYRELETITPIRQLQVVQHSLEEVELKLVVPARPDAVQETRLREILVANLGHPFTIEISYHETIPRGPSGKFEDFLSEVGA